MRLMLIRMIGIVVACSKSMAIMMEMVIAVMKINPCYEEKFYQNIEILSRIDTPTFYVR